MGIQQMKMKKLLALLLALSLCMVCFTAFAEEAAEDEEEITAISEKIIANVSAKFGAQLRS